MFVQIGEDLKVDDAAKTLRLVKVGQQTLYFSDRPVRLAGHLKMAEYLEEWTTKAGKDNFGANPPNAVLSVYEPGQADSTLAVVEITHPKVDGADLVYNYKVIKGKLPASGGQTALFIDWIGVGGGVGGGFHGVGVGGRGVASAEAQRRRDPSPPTRGGECSRRGAGGREVASNSDSPMARVK